ncbi:MAG: hypothetical protein RL539_635, partial [Pseudomonadota bacterium]
MKGLAQHLPVKAFAFGGSNNDSFTPSQKFNGLRN